MTEIERTEKGKVADYYRGETVLVTGFTGYLGKQLVEKLLWSCPELRRIYVLVRSKKGVDPQLRVQQVLESKAFDRLRKHHPERMDKVVGVSGDVTLEGLALSEEDKNRVISEVSVVLHGAASVRFDDPLSEAVDINIKGTQRMINLAQQMQNLKSYNHISTAYVNCDRRVIEEKLYPAKMKWRDLIRIVDKVDTASLNILTGKMLGMLPNTYVFTKSVAEHMVEEAKMHIPLVMTRPSIVTAAETEPSPGWVDTLLGPMGLIIGIIVGLIRQQLNQYDCGLDYIYSDYVVKGLLTAATHPSDPLSDEEVPLFHICASRTHLISTKYIMEMMLPTSLDHFTKLDTLVISVSATDSEFWFSIKFLYKHLLSGYFIDAVLRLLGHKPLLVRLRRKYHLAAFALKHFTTNTFYFQTDNYRNLMDTVKQDEEFYIDLYSPANKMESSKNAFFGVLKYTALKEIFDDLSKNRIYLKALYYLDLTAEYLTYSLLAYLLYFLNVPQWTFYSLDSFFFDPLFF